MKIINFSVTGTNKGAKVITMTSSPTVDSKLKTRGKLVKMIKSNAKNSSI